MQQECVASKQAIRAQQKKLADIERAQQLALEAITAHFATTQRQLNQQRDELEKQFARCDERHNELNDILPAVTPKKRPAPLASIVTSSAKLARKGQAKRAKAEAAPIVLPVNEFAHVQHTDCAWDLGRCGQFGMIRNMARTVTTTESGWNVVVATSTARRFSVLVTLPKNKMHNTIAIGFTHEPEFWRDPIDNPPVFYFNHTGWYVNVRKGSLCSRDHDDSPFVSKLKSGDVLTCIWDADAGTIRFLRNDLDLGVAFKGIFGAHDWQLYPALISYDKNIEITLLHPTPDGTTALPSVL
ncbi:hypothetical protein ACHHYP_02333 [Achlya hypogyna]|uniref:B30.2/SPRY domain-containing protein n=1 Tax=Achlya hypogyna TaxID=1202772 RepID=A0A1V9Z6V5_ACHHY|nr:hypothetical protein ACHHYP_02333 [Achlya hypogyna]